MPPPSVPSDGKAGVAIPGAIRRSSIKGQMRLENRELRYAGYRLTFFMIALHLPEYSKKTTYAADQKAG